MDVEAQKFFLRVVKSKLHRCAVGDDLVDGNFRRRGVKGLPSAEGRNQHAHALGGNPAHSHLKKAQVAASDGYFLDGDKGVALRHAVAKDQSLQNAAWKREISLAKGADFHLAIARLPQIL